MKIIIETIPHSQQRYDTAGDWQFSKDVIVPHRLQPGEVLTFTETIVVAEDTLRIKVSRTGCWQEEALVGIHELIEAILCRNAGVKEADVDRWDRTCVGRHQGDEPGDNPAAPYHRQHMIASALERLLAVELGVSWPDYEEHLAALVWQPPASVLQSSPPARQPREAHIRCSVFYQDGTRCVREVRHEGHHWFGSYEPL